MARSDFIRYMSVEIGSTGVVELAARLDAEDPGYYLEWWWRWEAGEIPREPVSYRAREKHDAQTAG